MTNECPYKICDGSGFIVDPEKRRTEHCRCRPEKIARLKATKLEARIPNRYRGVGFDRPPVTLIHDSIVREIRRYVTHIERNLTTGQSVWLEGPNGTGKTTLAMLISAEAIRAGHTVAIYSVPRLLHVMRKALGNDIEMTHFQMLDALASVDLLHLDDLGAQRDNEWVVEQLYSVINSRYEERRAIVLTTNKTYDELAEEVGDRIVSRLAEMCGELKLPLHGVDHRIEHDVPEVAPAPAAAPWASGPLVYGQPPRQ